MSVVTISKSYLPRYGYRAQGPPAKIFTILRGRRSIESMVDRVLPPRMRRQTGVWSGFGSELVNATKSTDPSRSGNPRSEKATSAPQSRTSA